jgi:hypothetical protein
VLVPSEPLKIRKEKSMNVIVEIGDNYAKTCYCLPIEEAVKVMAILHGKGVKYNGEDVYFWKHEEIKIIDKKIILPAIVTPPTLPPQQEDAINQF